MLICYFLFYTVFSLKSIESDDVHRICVSGIDSKESCLSLSPIPIFVEKDNLMDYLIRLQEKKTTNVEITVIDSPFSCPNKIELDISNKKLSFITLLKIRNGESEKENSQFIKFNQLVSEIPFQTLFLDGINILYQKSSKEKSQVDFKSLILIQSSILSFSQSNLDKIGIQKDYLSINCKDLLTDSYSLLKSGNSIQYAKVSDNYVKFLGFPKYESNLAEFHSKTSKSTKQRTTMKKIEIISTDDTKKSLIQQNEADSYINEYLSPLISNSNQQSNPTHKRSVKEVTKYYVYPDRICESANISECDQDNINQTIDTTEVEVVWCGGDQNITEFLAFNIEISEPTFITFTGFNIFYSQFMPNITNLYVFHLNCSVTLSSANPDEPVPAVTVFPSTGVSYRPRRDRQLKYCVCLQSRFQRCKQSLECSDDGVDPDNYVTGKEESFLDAIADYRTASNVRLIITHTGNEVMNIDFKTFYTSKEITFVSASNDITTNVCLREDRLSESTKNFSVRFSKITNVNVDYVFQNLIFLILQNSNLQLDMDREIANMFTDAYSIQNIEKKLTVAGMMAINSSSPLQLPKERIYLKNGSLLYMPSISGFSHIVIGGETDSTDRYIKFSDEDDIYSMTFMFIEYNQSIIASKASESNINITIDSGEAEEDTANPNKITNFFFDVAPYGMQIEFLNPIPAWMKFHFVPDSPLDSSDDDEIAEERYGVGLNLTIDNPTGPINFGNITGNFDLILMSASTLQHFFTYGIKESYSEENLRYDVSNITALTIDFQDNLTSVKFTAKNIQYGTGSDTNTNDDTNTNANTNTNDDTNTNANTNTLELPRDLAYTYRITTTSPQISFDIDKDASVLESEFYLLNETTNVSFSENFKGKDPEEMQKLNFVHFDNDVEFIAKTGLDCVPYVNLTYNVTGVLFSSEDTDVKKIEVKSVEAAYGANETRYGPNITVEVAKDPGYVLQEAVLAESVIFEGDPFIFVVSGASRAGYVFQTNVTFAPRSQYPNFTVASKGSEATASTLLADEGGAEASGSVSFDANSVSFGANGGISQNEGDNKQSVSINANDFSAEQLSSIDSSKFGPDGGVNVKNSASFPDSTKIDQVTLGDKTMSAKSADGSTTPTITGSSDDAQFQVDTNEKDVTLDCNDKSLPNNVVINTGPDTQTVNFDKSWNGVTNPEGITVNLQNRNTELNTDLLELPNVNLQVNGKAESKDNLNVNEHSPKLTGQLGFFIFIGIFAFVLILTLGFAIIGCCSLDKEKKPKDLSEEEDEDEKEKEKKEKKEQKKKEKAAKKEGDEKEKDEKKKAADEAKQQKAAEKAAKKGEKDAEKEAKKAEKEAKKAEKKAEKADKKADKGDKGDKPDKKAKKAKKGDKE